MSYESAWIAGREAGERWQKYLHAQAFPDPWERAEGRRAVPQLRPVTVLRNIFELEVLPAVRRGAAAGLSDAEIVTIAAFRALSDRATAPPQHVVAQVTELLGGRASAPVDSIFDVAHWISLKPRGGPSLSDLERQWLARAFDPAMQLLLFEIRLSIAATARPLRGIRGTELARGASLTAAVNGIADEIAVALLRECCECGGPQCRTDHTLRAWAPAAGVRLGVFVMQCVRGWGKSFLGDRFARFGMLAQFVARSTDDGRLDVELSPHGRIVLGERVCVPRCPKCGRTYALLRCVCGRRFDLSTTMRVAVKHRFMFLAEPGAQATLSYDRRAFWYCEAGGVLHYFAQRLGLTDSCPIHQTQPLNARAFHTLWVLVTLAGDDVALFPPARFQELEIAMGAGAI